ncbi:uncharacterized protein LOC123552197 [Mercenaria mercenaria]|uniref:uncharacterized protein LOC123552197 n=1 Tax=Mercenaria mercenaria TaxID=6596 RepID=UPI00234E5ED8|nr:uncharacterized protein LOC123552197 [Mercenaria mercenaria]
MGDSYEKVEDALKHIKIDMQKLKISTAFMDNRLKRTGNRLTHRMSTFLREIELKISSKPGCQSGTLGDKGFPTPPTFPIRRTVRFDPPFSTPPAIVFGLHSLDVHHGFNLRITAEVVHLSESSFSFKIRTWGDTVVYISRVSWMACPK